MQILNIVTNFFKLFTEGECQFFRKAIHNKQEILHYILFLILL